MATADTGPKTVKPVPKRFHHFDKNRITSTTVTITETTPDIPNSTIITEMDVDDQVTETTTTTTTKFTTLGIKHLDANGTTSNETDHTATTATTTDTPTNAPTDTHQDHDPDHKTGL